MRGKASLFLTLTVACTLTSCSGIAKFTGIPSSSPGGGISAVPQLGHIVIVVEENHSYGDVIGNSSMPYLNSLASTYALATNYFADAHPSIPNYFMLTAGQFVTFDDSFTGTINVDNLARRLITAGKTWKSYAEDLPAVGYTGGNIGLYSKNHNPLAYFSDVANDPAQVAKLVPFSQFSGDLASGQLPSFSFVAPNINNDAHDGTLAAADTWLQANIDALFSSPQFQQDGLLIVLFDEGEFTDLSHLGGHIAVVFAGPVVKRGYKSTTFYQHESTLRLILKALGVNAFPGISASATDMGEFFVKQ